MPITRTAYFCQLSSGLPHFLTADVNRTPRYGGQLQASPQIQIAGTTSTESSSGNATTAKLIVHKSENTIESICVVSKQVQ